jgi:hypothetical protein
MANDSVRKAEGGDEQACDAGMGFRRRGDEYTAVDAELAHEMIGLGARVKVVAGPMFHPSYFDSDC